MSFYRSEAMKERRYLTKNPTCFFPEKTPFGEAMHILIVAMEKNPVNDGLPEVVSWDNRRLEDLGNSMANYSAHLITTHCEGNSDNWEIC